MSRLRLIRNVVALPRIDETSDLSIEEKAARRKWKNAPIFDCISSKNLNPQGFHFNKKVREMK